MNKGEVWFVEFPLEEDESKSINRPVIVLDENILGVLSVKITKHKARKEDPYDIPIIYWEEVASLRTNPPRPNGQKTPEFAPPGFSLHYYEFISSFCLLAL